MVLITARHANHVTYRPVSPALTAGRPGAGGLSGVGVGAPHPAAPLRRPLILVQTAPSAVLFGPAHRGPEALGPDRAGLAELLRLALTDVAFWLPFSVRAEKQHNLLATAGGAG